MLILFGVRVGAAVREDLLALIEAQARMIEELRAEVVGLKRRLGRNSGNSSQPPSADGLAVSPVRTARRRSGRKPGKQPGSGGSALFQISDPDQVVDHVPGACGGCGSDLAGASAAGVVRRQVHDIPTIAPVVVEHRLHRRRCDCGATTTAPAPGRGGRGGGVRAEPARWRCTCWYSSTSRSPAPRC